MILPSAESLNLERYSFISDIFCVDTLSEKHGSYLNAYIILSSTFNDNIFG